MNRGILAGILIALTGWIFPAKSETSPCMVKADGDNCNNFVVDGRAVCFSIETYSNCLIIRNDSPMRVKSDDDSPTSGLLSYDGQLACVDAALADLHDSGRIGQLNTIIILNLWLMGDACVDITDRYVQRTHDNRCYGENQYDMMRAIVNDVLSHSLLAKDFNMLLNKYGLCVGDIRSAELLYSMPRTDFNENNILSAPPADCHRALIDTEVIITITKAHEK